MEENPYQAPRDQKPLTAARAIKRSIGAGIILILTPIAVAVAFGASCAATNAFLNTNIFGQNYLLVFIVAWAVFLLPPAAVLAGMLWWAIRARRQTRDCKKTAG